MPTKLTIAGQPVTVVERLGRGSTSQVWLVEDAVGRRLALKLGRGPGEATRFADEAERLLFASAAELPELVFAGRFESSIAVEDERFEAGSPFLALSWIEGTSLERMAGERASERLALSVARDVGAALTALHASGTAHGDVKPSNIVVAGDETRGFRAGLVDLGLAAALDQATPSGGTRRYLAPEVFTGAAGDARARDLWALGLTLLDLVEPGIKMVDAPIGPGLGQSASGALGAVIRALLAASPGVRPSAHWVWSRALSALGSSEATEAGVERRQRMLRRAYLSTHRHELGLAASGRDARVLVQGAPGRWLSDALALLRSIADLRGTPSAAEPLCELRDLDVLGRARFLVALVGPSAASWPALEPATDAAEVERLLGIVRQIEPESITFAALHGSAASESLEAGSITSVEVALALREALPDPAVLDRGETLVRNGEGGLPLALGLSRALRLRGELGRALALLADFSEIEARVEAAEVARRAGARGLAEELLAPLDPGLSSTAIRGRAQATRARLALDAGEPAAALRLLDSESQSSAVWETRALVELALGQRERAARSAGRARAHATLDEERARAEGLLGMLAHAAGDAEGARLAFRTASDFAARAGALLEEATYLTGLAAAAADLGELGDALSCARRALLLFEHLGRASDAARATLSLAAAYAMAGAGVESEAAALDALLRARASGDRRCQAYAHLVLADASGGQGQQALEHARRAAGFVDGVEDELRVGSRLLISGADVDLARLDAFGRDPELGNAARLDWWGARALTQTLAEVSAGGEAILAELGALLSARAPLSVRGQACHRGALLAARIGDGDAARRLTLSAGDAAREFLRRVPAELASAARTLEWVRADAISAEHGILPEQVRDVEALVHALGRRDRLRPLLAQVVDALVLWTGVERGLLLLRAPGGKLRPRAARNLLRRDLGPEQLALSHSLAERALVQGETVVAVDAEGDLSELHASVHALKLRSVLAVPLIARGEALGVVYLDDRVRRGAFGPRELAWVRLVATLAAIAIADARNQLLLRRAARRAQRAEARLARELATREVELDVAERELALVRDARETRFSYDEIVGTSEAVRSMLTLVDRVTTSEVPVLIVGESGSGKELVARAIHFNGPRKKRAFVSENCAAIPEGLLESTLFGHVRGAFTGAARPRAGLFEIADHGSLFLDEIAEMSLGMQSKLLRILQNGELHPVGSDTPRQVDVRVIAATHRDLAALVSDGRFREDLYYRLNVITLSVPPLRERHGDVAVLVHHLIGRYAGGRKVSVSRAALDALGQYRWPGNVRQLENEVRRALVLADHLITPEHLSAEILAPSASEASPKDGLNLRERVDALEVELVQNALRRTEGNQTRAAALLGLSRFGLQKMMKRLELSKEQPGSLAGSGAR